MTAINALVDAATAAFAAARAPADLENAKAQYLGKAGRITELMKGLGALPVDEKKAQGARINLAKQFTSLDQFLQAWNSADRKQALIQELESQGVLLEALAEEVEAKQGGKKLDAFDLFHQHG